MPTGKDLTAEQWDEIYAARERLWQYKLKIQPYPAYPSESAPEPYRGEGKEKQVVEHIVRHSDMSKQDFRKLRDLEGQVKYLQNKVAERTKPKQPKAAGYKDIR